MKRNQSKGNLLGLVTILIPLGIIAVCVLFTDDFVRFLDTTFHSWDRTWKFGKAGYARLGLFWVLGTYLPSVLLAMRAMGGHEITSSHSGTTSRGDRFEVIVGTGRFEDYVPENFFPVFCAVFIGLILIQVGLFVGFYHNALTGRSNLDLVLKIAGTLAAPLVGYFIGRLGDTIGMVKKILVGIALGPFIAYLVYVFPLVLGWLLKK